VDVACIGMIETISPIANADRIQSAVVVCGKFGKWYGIVQVGQFNPGDIVEVYLQDAIVPNTDRFAFMEKRDWRVKIQTMRGSRSECLIMPNETGLDFIGAPIDGIEKYEKPIDAKLAGTAKGNFPWYIPKTDEVNFQACPDVIREMLGKRIYITEKADGSSTTVYHFGEAFGVCSRNIDLVDTPGSAQWAVSKAWKIHEALAKLPFNAALQYEIVGPGIQGNPMGLEAHEPRAFDLYNIDEHVYADFDELIAFCNDNCIPMVRLVGLSFLNNADDDNLIAMSHGQYDNDKPREGIVIRTTEYGKTVDGKRLSFKVINPDYGR
jgi:RNA ligase (TIGR02306 family)